MALINYETLTLSGKVSQEARTAASALAQSLTGCSLDLELCNSPVHRKITLPAEAARLLLTMLEEMAEGHAVTVLPLRAELSTQEAAQLLNVSRPYLVALVEKGDIPFRKVGTHRRVRLGDLLEYKKRDDAARKQTLDALTAQAQELGLGY